MVFYKNPLKFQQERHSSGKGAKPFRPPNPTSDLGPITCGEDNADGDRASQIQICFSDSDMFVCFTWYNVDGGVSLTCWR